MPICRCFLLWLLLLPCCALASHLKGGEITINQEKCGAFEYEIVLTIYTSFASEIMAGEGVLSFGDGSTLTVPGLISTLVDKDFNVGKAVFKIVHNFTKAGQYVISYTENNRNAGILNIVNSGLAPFYIETQLNVISGVCNNPVSFNILPIDRACQGISFSHNPGAIDIDGDSISYEIFIPKTGKGQDASGFALPNDKTFYSGIDFQKANEAQDGSPLFLIDRSTGLLIWDAPWSIGQYATALKVTEWRKIDGQLVNLGYTIRDMQILVEDCNNTRPFLMMPTDICVKPGDNIMEIIKGLDKEFEPVKIEVFTADNFLSSSPLFLNQDEFQSTTSPFDTASIKFSWNITCELVRDQPYKIIFKITDQPVDGVRLSTFATWTIFVVGEAPEYKALELNLSAKTLKIEWEPYACENAKTIEIWRRVGEVQYAQDDCSRGIPKSLGFEKIGSIMGSTVFIDKDLNPGAQYCYRLVAFFENPNKSLSIAAKDTCIGPIVVDAPVVTNVSVSETDSLAGAILVRWTSPFQIDKIQFPPPYEYELYRAKTENEFVKAIDHRISDTTYVDTNLNTTEELYGYKVVVYSPNGLSKENPVDTSAVAFYPRLNPEARKNGIYLQWSALVPWSNQSQQFPWHYIYRKESDIEFALIDSVNFNNLSDEKKFDYLDEGKYKGEKLNENLVYQYRISTSGTYGNPRIEEPIVNFSNEVFAQSIDSSPPCKPLLSLEMISCENFIKTYDCNFTDFKNTLVWKYSEDCGDDVSYYKILYANSQTENFDTIATAKDLSFIHPKQKSFSGCYKIQAVDRSGNIGDESEMVCNENCPNVFIPNVITPGNEDGLNDTFPGIANASDQKSDLSKCPRFVNSIDIKIFNRQGERVYTVSSQSQQSQFEWNGIDSNGKELPSGTYFYTVSIGFDVNDPDLQHQEIKGWVQLIR